MQLEYKDCGIRPATNPAEARRNQQEFERKREVAELERKAAAGDPFARRRLDLHRKLFGTGDGPTAA